MPTTDLPNPTASGITELYLGSTRIPGHSSINLNIQAADYFQLTHLQIDQAIASHFYITDILVKTTVNSNIRKLLSPSRPSSRISPYI